MYRKGALLSITGVLFMSFDAPLVRLITAESWAVVMWRGILMALAFALFGAARPTFRGKFFSVPSLGTFVAAGLFAASTILFVQTAKSLPVSSVLTILAMTPLAAALLSRIFLGEKLSISMLTSASIAAVGVALVVRGDWRIGALLGYVTGIMTVIAFGGYLTTLRSPLQPYAPQALAIAGTVAAVAAIMAGGALQTTVLDFGYLILLGLIVLPFSFVLLSLGTRYISAADVSLIMLLELILGVLWAWLFLNEQPAPSTILGIVVVLAALGLRATCAARSANEVEVK
jgi:drug/metabolite transporter (DMT)-like permease